MTGVACSAGYAVESKMRMTLSENRQLISSPSIVWNYVVAAGSGGLVLAAGLVNLLRFHAYPLTAPEVLLVYFGIVFISGLLGAIYLGLGRLVWPAMDALLVAIAVDLASDGLVAPLVGWAVALAAAYWLRRSLLPMIGTMAVIVLSLSVIGFGGSSASAKTVPEPGRNDRPAIVHILLDEHIGIEGLPEENAASEAMQKRLKDFYLENGFYVYGRAYSEHMHTVNSLPQIMNFGEGQSSLKRKLKDGVVIDNNAYFDHLRSLNYTLNVYQTDFIDICNHQMDARCITYPSAGLRGVAASELTRDDKAAIIASNLLALSEITRHTIRGLRGYVYFARAKGLEVPLGWLNETKTSSIHALAATDRLIVDLETAAPGQAYIAHLLLPHYPYLTEPDCRLKPRREWAYRRFHPEIRDREAAYFDQLLCVTNKVSAALAALERSPAAGNYIVVLHGDHGSRITVNDPLATSEHILDRDMIAVFSTLFAVKAPDIAKGYEGRAMSAPQILKSLVESGFSAGPEPPDGATAEVTLDDQQWRPIRRTALPANW